MARMHSRKKGKAGSKRPVRESAPSWIRYKPKEVELLITKLAKEGKPTSKIGIILRDTYGIPNIRELTGKKVNKILEENNLRSNLPEDLLALIKKSAGLRKHIETNNHDMFSKRGLTLTESKIKRLINHYKKTGKLPEEWKYNPEQVRMYLE